MNKHLVQPIATPSDSASQVVNDGLNMGDKVSAMPTPTIPTESSHHPNIMPNFKIALQSGEKLR